MNGLALVGRTPYTTSNGRRSYQPYWVAWCDCGWRTRPVYGDVKALHMRALHMYVAHGAQEPGWFASTTHPRQDKALRMLLSVSRRWRP